MMDSVQAPGSGPGSGAGSVPDSGPGSGPGSGSGSGPGAQLSVSFRLFLQETSSFKQQNPGKFCLLVCSVCSFLAVLGRYVPGILISYVLVLGFFLWPLASSHDLVLWLKPVLQKLDFGVGDFLHKIKENHERRLVRAEAEQQSIEADLSSMFPQLDSAACRDMALSDTEASDVTWTDGTFNLSEGHTPGTENSEDLDREEAFSGGLPEFPSLDNGVSTNGDDDDLSIGLPAPPPHPKDRPPRPPREAGDVPDLDLNLVHRIAGDAIAAAVTAAVRERIEAAVLSGLSECSTPPPQDQDSDSEVEDFELLDQSELEQLEGELGLGEKKKKKEVKGGVQSSSFFSKLLGRH